MKNNRSISRRLVRSGTRRMALGFLISDLVLLSLLRGGHLAGGKGGAWLTLAALQLVLLLISARLSRRKTRRTVEPLERMAQTAQEISHAGFDQEKLRRLEHSIVTLKQLTPGERLRTGDQELSGLEEAINDLLSRMNESFQERSRFVSDASHELRTPISVIQGYADMLKRWGKDDPKVLDEGLSAIQSESVHMKNLIEQLLFLARGDSNRNQLNIEILDLSLLMREVYEESSMIYPRRQWKLDAPEPVAVRGDQDMLKQTMRILVDNAVKYTPEDARVTLRTRFKNNCPCFEVQDNGIGIKQDDLAHIFDRFFRSDPARNRATGGTGLGLSIAKWIVEKHGGYFEVFSREDIGTRIDVMLPQSETEEAQEQNAPQPA